MVPIINADGTFLDPELIEVCEGCAISIAMMHDRWTYGFEIDMQTIKDVEPCSKLNDFFDTRDNAIAAAIIEMSRRAKYANELRLLPFDDGAAPKEGNPEIPLDMFLRALDKVQQDLVLHIEDTIFP